jgi:hypothetical protein
MPPKISAKQLAANRAGARRPTGPRAAEGKAASARNARKHLSATSSFPVPVFESFDDLVELRAARLESGLFPACLQHASDTEPVHLLNRGFGEPDLKICKGQRQNFALPEGFLNLTATSQSRKFFLNCQAQTERLYRRAIEDFDRPELPNEPICDAQPDETEPPPISPNEPVSSHPRSEAPPIPAPAGRRANLQILRPELPNEPIRNPQPPETKRLPVQPEAATACYPSARNYETNPCFPA